MLKKALFFLITTFFGTLGTMAAPPAISVADDAGQKIHLQSPAKRIVALSPNVVDTLYDAGAGNKIVGSFD